MAANPCKITQCQGRPRCALCAELDRQYGRPAAPSSPDEVREAAERLVAEAAAAGFVLTIEQRPLQPLAMGHYETVVSVRPARGRA